MTRFKSLILGTTALLSAGLLISCNSGVDTKAPDAPQASREASTETKTELSINYEKFTLDNGLDVILHVDRSDPIVAIDLAVHVGSGRETPGRTGFAHLFEHLLFLDSENLGYGGLDEMNTRIGGEGTNGFTTNDMTQYFQAVPADALEKIIWAEADKLGYFIKTVSQDVVDNEKQVVKNEKRQRVDNRPYGHTFYVVSKALYPEGHPYNWQVIGSLADLDAATLEDVQTFYKRWYVPNNVTVTISGDFDPAEAKQLVEKYFGEIPAGEPVERMAPMPGKLDAIRSLYHEDNFATAAQLTRVWPTVEDNHPDSYALNFLTTYLTDGKRAPLNAVLIDEEKVTTSVSMFNYEKELASELWLSIDANEGDDLDDMQAAIAKAFARFEQDGISQDDLDRIKAQQEVQFYGQVQSALGKAIQLGEYNVFTGNPGFYKTDIARIQSVTTDDVMRVYNQYIKDQPYITTSFVPKDQLGLALEGAVKADVVEEKIVQGAEATADFDPAARVIDDPTPSSFDRTIEPDFGTPYTLPTPVIWRETLSNGIKVMGIESNETPLVSLNLKIDAGRKRNSADKPGIASLTTDMLEKGTANLTVSELEDALKSLGSTITFSVSGDGVTARVSTLARNVGKTVDLLEDMLLEPRWDATEFDLLKAKVINDVKQAATDPNSLASREAAKLHYPEGHPFHHTSYGPVALLETVTLDDLKAFYAAYYTPANATITIAGDLGKADMKSAFSGLESRWAQDGPDAITTSQAKPIESSSVYVYDVPGAKQSVLSIQRPTLSATDSAYPLLQAVNFPLGGIYTSELNTELRVNKGYTYGIRSGFYGSQDRGLFSINSSVRTNVTLESLELIRDIVTDYGPNFSDEDLTILKAARLRGQALSNETLSDKLSMLNQIRDYDYGDDFRTVNAQRVQDMTLADFKALTDQYLRPDAMNYVVVGDAQSQAERLEALGYGAPIMLGK